MKNILFIIFVLFFVTSHFAQAQQQSNAGPSFQECVGNGGYDTKARVWKKIPACEQARWGICSAYYSYTPGGTTWATFVKSSNGIKYNCADFARDMQQNDNAPSGAAMTSTTVDSCIYAQYRTYDWSVRLQCNNIHLDVCKELYRKANTSWENFANTDPDGRSFDCDAYTQSQITGSTTPAPGTSNGGSTGSPQMDPSSGSGSTSSASQQTLVQQCNEVAFLSTSWYLRGCRNVQLDVVKQYCISTDPSNESYKSLNCAEFAVAQGTIGSAGGSSQNTNPFGLGNQSSSPTTSSTNANSVGANCSAKFRSLVDFLSWIRCLIGIIIPLGLSIAFIVFLFNVIRYVIAPNPTKDNERRKYIYWAMLGLFVLVAVWGIVAFVTNTFGLGFVVPQLPTK